jgi:hypothetical protein
VVGGGVEGQHRGRPHEGLEAVKQYAAARTAKALADIARGRWPHDRGEFRMAIGKLIR